MRPADTLNDFTDAVLRSDLRWGACTPRGGRRDGRWGRRAADERARWKHPAPHLRHRCDLKNNTDIDRNKCASPVVSRCEPLPRVGSPKPARMVAPRGGIVCRAAPATNARAA